MSMLGERFADSERKDMVARFASAALVMDKGQGHEE